MNELIQILEISQSKNGADFPLTIGHLLNICKKAESLKNKRLEREAVLEDEQHRKLLNEIGDYSQN